MRSSARSSFMSLAVVGILILLLAVLATLQYRWIAQLSDAERASLQAGLDRAAADFCKDFDREIARAFDVFNLERQPGEEELPRLLGDRLNRWRSAAVWPEMVEELVVLRLLETGEIVTLCFNEQSSELLPCDPNDEVERVLEKLGNRGPRVPTIDGALPGLVMVIEEQVAPVGEAPFGWRPPRDHIVVRLDLDVITQEILPRLADTHFRVDGGPGYRLVVSSIDRPGETIFATERRTTSRAVEPDAIGRLLGLRPFRELSDAAHRPPRVRRPRPPGPNPERRAEGPPQNPPPPDLRTRTEEGRWRLTVQHPEGSLEAVVRNARRRNMAISLATLALLGVTAVLMMLSTRRAQRLARQQMDFVAAVSHELRTPLTAIRSAGQNLADGIIAEPDKVQSYGLLIEREGRRLTEMIGRVLTFAGIRSGRQIYRMEPVDVGDIVRATLEDGSWVLGESDVEVETEIAENLPIISGDAAALRQVVTNLVDNALKYAAVGRWLGVRVGFDAEPGGGEVWIAVADRGPGIVKRELQAVFEPFRRGSGVTGNGAPGSGLGLAVVRSIVEAHGGRIDVTSPQGAGAIFTVRLPAAPEVGTERGEQK